MASAPAGITRTAIFRIIVVIGSIVIFSGFLKDYIKIIGGKQINVFLNITGVSVDHIHHSGGKIDYALTFVTAFYHNHIKTKIHESVLHYDFGRN